MIKIFSFASVYKYIYILLLALLKSSMVISLLSIFGGVAYMYLNFLLEFFCEKGQSLV